MKKYFHTIAAFMLFLVTTIVIGACSCNKIKLTKLELDTTNVNTTIVKGNELDLSGLVVKAVYSDDSKKELTADEYSVDKGQFNKDVLGEYSITVSYDTVKESFKVSVVDNTATITSLRIDTTEAKTIFSLGEDFSAQGLAVYGVYSNSSEVKLTSDQYTINSQSYVKTSAGTYSITVTLNTNTSISGSYQVTVSGPNHVLSGIEVATQEMKTEYAINDDFDASGLKVYKKYSDNQRELIVDESEYTIDSSAFNGSLAGTYTITVTLNDGGFSTTFSVTVASAIAREVILDTDSVKKVFEFGEEFNSNGLVVKVKYSDESVQPTQEYQVISSSYRAITPGTYTIRVVVGSLNATYQVEVNELDPSRVEELLNFASLTLKDSDNNEYVLDVSDFEEEISIYYLKDTTFTVDVTTSETFVKVKFDDDSNVFAYHKSNELYISMILYIDGYDYYDSMHSHTYNINVTSNAYNESLDTLYVGGDNLNINQVNSSFIVNTSEGEITITSSGFDVFNGNLSWKVDGVLQESNSYTIADLSQKNSVVITYVQTIGGVEHLVATVTINFASDEYIDNVQVSYKDYYSNVNEQGYDQTLTLSKTDEDTYYGSLTSFVSDIDFVVNFKQDETYSFNAINPTNVIKLGDNTFKLQITNQDEPVKEITIVINISLSNIYSLPFDEYLEFDTNMQKFVGILNEENMARLLELDYLVDASGNKVEEYSDQDLFIEFILGESKFRIPAQITLINSRFTDVIKVNDEDYTDFNDIVVYAKLGQEVTINFAFDETVYDILINERVYRSGTDLKIKFISYELDGEMYIEIDVKDKQGNEINNIDITLTNSLITKVSLTDKDYDESDREVVASSTSRGYEFRSYERVSPFFKNLTITLREGYTYELHSASDGTLLDLTTYTFNTGRNDNIVIYVKNGEKVVEYKRLSIWIEADLYASVSGGEGYGGSIYFDEVGKASVIVGNAESVILDENKVDGSKDGADIDVSNITLDSDPVVILLTFKGNYKVVSELRIFKETIVPPELYITWSYPEDDRIDMEIGNLDTHPFIEVPYTYNLNNITFSCHPSDGDYPYECTFELKENKFEITVTSDGNPQLPSSIKITIDIVVINKQIDGDASIIYVVGAGESLLDSVLVDESGTYNISAKTGSSLLITTNNPDAHMVLESTTIEHIEYDGQYGYILGKVGVYNISVTVTSTNGEVINEYTLVVSVEESPSYFSVDSGTQSYQYGSMKGSKFINAYSQSEYKSYLLAMFDIAGSEINLNDMTASINFAMINGVTISDANGQISGGKRIVNLTSNAYGINYKFTVTIDGETYDCLIIFSYKTLIAEFTIGNQKLEYARYDNGIYGFDYLNDDSGMAGFFLGEDLVESGEDETYKVTISIKLYDNSLKASLDGESPLESLNNIELNLTYMDMEGISGYVGMLMLLKDGEAPTMLQFMFSDIMLMMVAEMYSVEIA